MKLNVDTFEVESSKVKENKRIITMADIHLTRTMNKNILKLIKDFLDQGEKIDLIAIPGDIMYSQQYSMRKNVEKLEYLLKSLSEIAPIALSLGNHDIQHKNEEKAKKVFKNLEKNEDVFPLVDEKVQISEMEVAGFSPKSDVYSPSNHGDVANKRFVEDFIASGLEFNEDEFNILLNHAPHPIASDYAQRLLREIFEKIDLILAGHLHNGYVPGFIEQRFRDIIADYGVWEKLTVFPPFVLAKINLCRGIHKLNNANLVVTKGVRKYTGFLPSFLPISPNITDIKVVKEEQSKIK